MLVELGRCFRNHPERLVLFVDFHRLQSAVVVEPANSGGTRQIFMVGEVGPRGIHVRFGLAVLSLPQHSQRFALDISIKFWSLNTAVGAVLFT